MRIWTRRGVVASCAAVLVAFIVIFAFNVSSIGDWRAEDLGEGWRWCAARAFSEPLIDSEGNPHVIYTAYDGIVYAQKVGGEWSTRLIPLTISQFDGGTCCAAIDGQDNIHVFISQVSSSDPSFDPKSLSYLTNAGGSWTESQVAGLPDVDYYYSMACAVGPQGDIHVLSSGVTRSTDPGESFENIRVVHWHSDGGVWDVSNVMTLPTEWYTGSMISDMALDSAGGIHAIVYDYWRDVGMGYISYDGSEWTLETTNWFPLSYPSMALEGDSPLIAINDGNDVVVLSKETGTWHELLRTEAAAYADLDIAVAGDGTVHIVHGYVREDNSGNGLRHAEFRDGAIESTDVSDRVSYLSLPAVTVDSDGKPHICYVTDGYDVKYATPMVYNSALLSAAADAALKTILICGSALVVAAIIVLAYRGCRRHGARRTKKFNED